MKIVVDQHIPFIADIFSEIGELVLIPGQNISKDSIGDADALIVRSITTIDRPLLEKSRVRFVGSATAGLDHVDLTYLQGAGIRFEHAPGANAESVAEYVFACLAAFGSLRGDPFTSRTIGIIGAGNVGGLLARRCRALGMKTLVNDPPLASTGGTGHYAPLSEVLEQSNIISVHTPLVKDGLYPTLGLIGSVELSKMKPDVWVVHSARGGVCHEAALLSARSSGRVSALALDVWENEPTPLVKHVLGADIATGHIAGYSLDAKRAGVIKLREDLIRHFGLGSPARGQAGTRGGLSGSVNTHFLETGGESRKLVSFRTGDTINDLVTALYPVMEDDIRFKASMKVNSNDPMALAEAFHAYRATYPVRRRFGSYAIDGPIPKEWAKGMGLEP